MYKSRFISNETLLKLSISAEESNICFLYCQNAPNSVPFSYMQYIWETDYKNAPNF